MTIYKKMKNIILLLSLFSSIVVQAQTEFRHISLDEALAAARKEKKIVFIDFYTDWCGPCKRMAKEVFPQEKVGEYMNSRCVCIKLNAEKEGKETAAAYKVEAYPTFIMADVSGKEIAKIVGSMDADRFLARMEECLNPDMSPEKIKASYLAGDRTPIIVEHYISLLMREEKYEDGMKTVDEYYESLSEKQRLEAGNAFLFTRYTTDLSDKKARFMVEHSAGFAPEIKSSIGNKIAMLYRMKLTTYFSGYQLRSGQYKEEEYQALKDSINKLGLDAKGNYAPVYRLIEARAALGDADFIDKCEAEYKNLNSSDANLLVMNLTRLVETKDKAVLKKMSAFIRSHLSEMTPSCLSSAARILEEIEAE